MIFTAGENKKIVSFPTDNDHVTGPEIHYSVHIVPTADILLGDITETIITVVDNDGKQWIQLALNDCCNLPFSLLLQLSILGSLMCQEYCQTCSSK